MYLLLLIGLGLITGVVLFVFLAYKFTTFFSSNPSIDDEEIHGDNEEELIPLAYRINNAIFDTERSLIACDEKIEELVKDMDELLSGVGEKSYVFVPQKSLFLQFTHPLSNESFYLYTKELFKDQDSFYKEKQLCHSIQKQIDVLMSQRTFLQKLLKGHVSNLQRVEGTVRQSEHHELLNSIEEKIAIQSQDQTNDEQIFYNDMILKEIEEELDHKDECLKQYKILVEDLSHPSVEDEPVVEKIVELTQQLDDPDKKRED